MVVFVRVIPFLLKKVMMDLKSLLVRSHSSFCNIKIVRDFLKFDFGGIITQVVLLVAVE